ncbi:MAG: hypothetical protein ACR2QC_07740 [Gammaproteobacteria bacterium]
MVRTVARGSTPPAGPPGNPFAGVGDASLEIINLIENDRTMERRRRIAEAIAAALPAAPGGPAGVGTPGGPTTSAAGTASVVPGTVDPARKALLSLSPEDQVSFFIESLESDTPIDVLKGALGGTAVAPELTKLEELDAARQRALAAGNTELAARLQNQIVKESSRTRSELAKLQDDLARAQEAGETGRARQLQAEIARRGQTTLTPAQRTQTRRFQKGSDVVGIRVAAAGSEQRIDALLAQGFQEIPVSVQAADPGVFEPTASVVSGVQDAEMGVRNFLFESDRVIQTLRTEGAAVLGAAGSVTQAINATASTIQGLQQTLFDKIPQNQRLSPTAFVIIDDEGRETAASVTEVRDRAVANIRQEDPGFFVELAAGLSARFEGAAINAAIVESNVVSLAFAAAAAAAQTGRGVSDKDIDRFMTQIGVSADPDVFEEVLIDNQERMINGLRNRVATVNRFVPPGQQITFPSDLNPTARRDRTPGITDAAGPTPTLTTRDEFEALPPGAVFIDGNPDSPHFGKLRRKP